MNRVISALVLAAFLAIGTLGVAYVGLHPDAEGHLIGCGFEHGGTCAMSPVAHMGALENLLSAVPRFLAFFFLGALLAACLVRFMRVRFAVAPLRRPPSRERTYARRARGFAMLGTLLEAFARGILHPRTFGA